MSDVGPVAGAEASGATGSVPLRTALRVAALLPRNPIRALTLASKHAVNGLAFLPGGAVAVVTDLELARAILGNRNLTRQPWQKGSFSALGPDALLSLLGEDHRHAKMAVLERFRPSNVAELGPVLQRHLDAWATQKREAARTGPVKVDLYAEMRVLVFNVVSEFLLGAPLDVERRTEMAKAMDYALPYAFRRTMGRGRPAPLRTPGFLARRGDARFAEAMATLRRLAEELLAEPAAPGTYLHYLHTCDVSEDGQVRKMTAQEKADHVLETFIAGHMTTTSGLAWATYFAALHPEQAAAAKAEARAMPQGPYSMDTFKQLSRVQGFLWESLRRRPPVVGASRVATENLTQLGPNKVSIPKGTRVLLTYKLLHDLADAGHPEFDPERFDDGKGTTLSFAYGEFSCIGQNMALFVSTGVLATTLREFELRPLSGGEVGDLCDSVVVRPKEPLWAELTPRTAGEVRETH